MRDWAKKAILGSGALRLAESFRGPSGAILMYHSVLQNPSLQIDSFGGIAHSESVFRGQIELLARDFQPISLAAAATFPSVRSWSRLTMGTPTTMKSRCPY